METKYVRRGAGFRDGLKGAARCLREGGLVLFPTETVYGLGANIYRHDAILRIFSIKGRPADNPIIVHIHDRGETEELWTDVTPIAERLMERFWPGPLTLVYFRKQSVDGAITAGLDTVSVRMPSNTIAHELLRLASVPVAAPSANLSGRPSITAFSETKMEMGGMVDYIIDGGRCRYGVESTVLDITGKEPVVLRPGAVSLESIRKVAGKVSLHPAARGSIVAQEKLPSPGMRYRHYAPVHATLYLFEGVRARERMLRCFEAVKGKRRTAMLVTAESEINAGDTYIMGSALRPITISRRLFSMLRLLDSEGYEIILSLGIDEKGLGLAVMNRLRRAATAINPEIIEFQR